MGMLVAPKYYNNCAAWEQKRQFVVIIPFMNVFILIVRNSSWKTEIVEWTNLG